MPKADPPTTCGICGGDDKTCPWGIAVDRLIDTFDKPEQYKLIEALFRSRFAHTQETD